MGKPASSVESVVVVDGTNTLYRAFFAIPGLRAPDGTPTNAALGFVNSLQKTIREESPDHVIVVLDARGKTFRHEMFDAYKAGRDATPEDLSAQIPLLRELLEAFHIPVLEVSGFEADDVIATLVARAPAKARMAVVSTDKDLMQLVTDRVTLLDGIKDRRYTPADVEERFGVPPEQILDLRALVGDPSDNIPGVKGIGEKGAAKLIQEWKTLDALLENAEEVKPTRAKNALAAGMEEARLSRDLATLRDDVPLPGDWPDWERQEPDTERLRELYTKLGFTRLLEALDADGSDAAPDAASDAVEIEIERIETQAALGKLVKSLAKQPSLALDLVCEGDVAVTALPVGLAIASDAAEAAYVPLQGGKLDLPQVAEALAPLLAAPGKVAWTSGDGKRIQALFAEQGVRLALPWCDVVLAAGLIDSSRNHDVATLASLHAGRSIQSWEQLAGRGAKAVPASELPLDDLESYAAVQACAVAALVPKLQARLDADGLRDLFEEVELPLTGVLAEMERAGVRIDEGVLETLSTEYAAKLEALEKEIHELAGEPFLISSTKQLQHILFEKLKLPVIKKTKTGYSTDEGVLEQLALQHDLPERILAYRRVWHQAQEHLRGRAAAADRPSAPAACTPPSTSCGAATGRLSSPPIPTCRTSPSARRRASGSARPSWPAPRAACWCPRTTPRWSCASSPTTAATSSLVEAFSERGTTSTAAPPPRSGSVEPEDVTADDACPGQGRELRDHLRALGLRPGEPARHRARGGSRDHRHLLRCATRACARFIDGTIEQVPRSRATSRPCWAVGATCRT